MKHMMYAALLLSLFSFKLSAQENYPRELGVRFGGIDLDGSGFDLIYKKQKAENKYHRWRATFGNLNVSANEDNIATNFSAGAAFGIENRRPLGNEFYFVRGPEINASLLVNTSEDDANAFIRLGAGYVLGLQYNCKKHFFFSLETIPGGSFTFNDDNVAFNLGFSSFAALTCGWRF